MNGRDQNTRRVSSVSYMQRSPLASTSIRARRKRRKRIIMTVAVAAVSLLLFAALIILIVHTAKRRSENPPEVPANTGTGAVVEKHGPELAYDSDASTRFISDSNQTAGSYYLLSLSTEADVMRVEIISDDALEYIREGKIQLSSDGVSWKDAGNFVCEPSSAAPVTVSPGYSQRASYVRLLLTSDASEKWVLNSICAYDNDGGAIPARSGSTGFTSGDEVTTPAATTAQSDGYVRLSLGYDDLHKGDLILVGPHNQYVFPTSTASILQIYDNRTPLTDGSGKTVYSLQIGDIESTLLEARVLKQLNAMTDAFYKETGITKLHVGTNSGYRSRETQAALASKYANAAQPGYSDHNTGLSINLDVFDGGVVYELGYANNADAVRALEWLDLNAASYGFVERFPAAKYSITNVTDDHHYRYVGVPHAWYMSHNGLVLEEYLTYLENNAVFGENTLKFTASDGRDYEVWFVPATGDITSVPVPEGREYTVSGNNYSGFIVTASGRAD